MNLIQQNIINDIKEKLDANNNLKSPEKFFSIGKDIIPSCPPDADMRDFVDPLIENMFLDMGFGYVKGLSNADEMTFVQVSEKEKENWVAQSIGIRLVSIVPNEIQGLDEFSTELRKYYNLSSTQAWAPACGSGMEIELIVTIGDYLLKFIETIVLPGIAWDMSKGVFSKLWNALNKLDQKNNNNLEVGLFEFKFNDITIKVHNRNLQGYDRMMKLFLSLREHINSLNSKGIEAISRIELPYIKVLLEDEVYYNCEPFEQVEEFLWKVTYFNGCSEMYYNPHTREMYEN